MYDERRFGPKKSWPESTDEKRAVGPLDAVDRNKGYWPNLDGYPVMTKVLVTGGAGFIGSHLVDALVKKGDEVVVIDALLPQVHESKPAYLNPSVDYVFSDLRDPKALDGVLPGVKVVYHLAAAVGIGQSMYEPRHYVEANSLATAILLQKIIDRPHRPEKLVVASSMSVYGEGSYSCANCGPVYPAVRTPERMGAGEWEVPCPNCGRSTEPLPTTEEKPLSPQSVYAVSKRDQEELSLSLGRAFALPTVALRFFNVYGSRQALSNPYTGVCAIFQSRLQNGARPVVFEDGRQSRDFVAVEDIVSALVRAGGSDRADFQSINVGAGRSVPIVDVARILAQLNGVTIEPEVTGQFRPGDIRHCFADISRARRLLGYEPAVPLERGLATFVEWSKSQRPKDRLDSAISELTGRGLLSSPAVPRK